jgi:hypothetical protein
MGAVILRGDAAHLPLAAESVDSVVCDPPYGLEFMGREWDTFRTGDGFRRSRNNADAGRNDPFGRTSRTSPEYVAGHPFEAWCESWATACLRVLKPGGYLLAFGGTRTWHRLACGIEDAGFEIRDSLHWMYGSGMPKGKACLKPAHEPIVMARKPAPKSAPLPGLDACRVTAGQDYADKRASVVGLDSNRNGDVYGERAGIRADSAHDAGRWPANILLSHTPECEMTGTRQVRGTNPPSSRGAGGRNGAYSPLGRQSLDDMPVYTDADGMETVETWSCADDCPVAELDRQSGERPAGGVKRGTHQSGRRPGLMGATVAREVDYDSYGDKGGASRFFPTFRYQAKAPASERPRIPRRAMRLRSDLTEDQRAYVLAELRKAGVDAA